MCHSKVLPVLFIFTSNNMREIEKTKGVKKDLIKQVKGKIIKHYKGMITSSKTSTFPISS